MKADDFDRFYAAYEKLLRDGCFPDEAFICLAGYASGLLHRKGTDDLLMLLNSTEPPGRQDDPSDVRVQ